METEKHQVDSTGNPRPAAGSAGDGAPAATTDGAQRGSSRDRHPGQEPRAGQEGRRDGSRGRSRTDRTRRERGRAGGTPDAAGVSAQAAENRSADNGKGERTAQAGTRRPDTGKSGEGRRDRQRGPRQGGPREGQPERERRMPDPARMIKKREETLEDIRADIERVEKDIQFEIKQIQTVALGL